MQALAAAGLQEARRARARRAARASARCLPASAATPRLRRGRGRRSCGRASSMSRGRRVPGVELDHVHLRRADQRGERVDLDHRLVAGRDRRVELASARGCRSVPACFWKKSWPPMPAGARTSATGRSTRCGSISCATRQVVVDEVELGDAGRAHRSTRSGLLMRMPSTLGVAARCAFFAARGAVRLRRGALVLRCCFAPAAVFAGLRRLLGVDRLLARDRCAPACRRAGRGRPRGGSGRRASTRRTTPRRPASARTQWPRTLARLARRTASCRLASAVELPAAATASVLCVEAGADVAGDSAACRARRGCRAAASRCRCASPSGRCSRRSRTPGAACT